MNLQRYRTVGPCCLGGRYMAMRQSARAAARATWVQTGRESITRTPHRGDTCSTALLREWQHQIFTAPPASFVTQRRRPIFCEIRDLTISGRVQQHQAGTLGGGTVRTHYGAQLLQARDQDAQGAQLDRGSKREVSRTNEAKSIDFRFFLVFERIRGKRSSTSQQETTHTRIGQNSRAFQAEANRLGRTVVLTTSS